MRRIGIAAVLALACLSALLAVPHPSGAASLCTPAGMTRGPDGNIWFAGGCGDDIGRVTPQGKVRLFKLPFPADPADIAAGPNNELYFTSYASTFIGRITTWGQASRLSLPASWQPPQGLTSAPDGSLWFVEGNNLARLTPALHFQLHRLPTRPNQLAPQNLAVSSLGYVWFTDTSPYRIKHSNRAVLGRLAPNGKVRIFPLGLYSSADPLDGLTLGPDGNLWYTTNAHIGRVTPSGANRVFPSAGGLGPLQGIVGVPPDRLWVSYAQSQHIKNHQLVPVPAAIGSISVGGVQHILRFPKPAPSTAVKVGDMVAGSGGQVWFPETTEAGSSPIYVALDRVNAQNRIVRFAVPGLPAPPIPTAVPAATPHHHSKKP